MSPATSKQTMKPVTAAKKLGIHLPAAPESFRDAPAITRSELARLMTAPPEWLTELRRTGPHPRDVVASRLGISIAGLARGGVSDPLTTEQIEDLRDEAPSWLARERQIFSAARDEEDRAKAHSDRTAARRAAGPPDRSASR